MASVDNAAGRLHSVLTAFLEHSAEGHNYRWTWAQTLGFDESSPEFRLALCRVAGMPAAVYDAVLRAGYDEELPSIEHWLPQWSQPILLWDVSTAAAVDAGLIKISAMHALSTKSTLLSAVASEGSLPGSDQIADVRAKVLAARIALLSADQLPPEVRRWVSASLYDILLALDTLIIGGSGAVIAATERFVGAVALRVPAEQRKNPHVNRAVVAAAAVWTLFLSAPGVQAALTAVPEIMRILGGGS